jgi:hypothetical protein
VSSETFKSFCGFIARLISPGKGSNGSVQRKEDHPYAFNVIGRMAPEHRIQVTEIEPILPPKFNRGGARDLAGHERSHRYGTTKSSPVKQALSKQLTAPSFCQDVPIRLSARVAIRFSQSSQVFAWFKRSFL